MRDLGVRQGAEVVDRGAARDAEPDVAVHATEALDRHPALSGTSIRTMTNGRVRSLIQATAVPESASERWCTTCMRA